MPKLIAVFGALHVMGGDEDRFEPTRFCIAFDGLPSLRIAAQGGDNVSLDREALEEWDMAEFGRVEIHDVTERISSGWRNREIEDPLYLHNGTGGAIGVVLKQGRETFCIWMEDDEFRWGSLEDALGSPFPPHVRPALASEPLRW